MTRSRQLYLRFWRIMSPVAIVCLRLFTAITNRARVRVIATNEFGEILFVKTVISSDAKWSLPGGGMNRNESASKAAQREFLEEVGVSTPLTHFKQSHIIQKSSAAKLYFAAIIFTVGIKKGDVPKVLHNPAEIEEIGWFRPNSLPTDMTPLAIVALRDVVDSGTMK